MGAVADRLAEDEVLREADIMRLWRERAAFSALLGRLGGMAKVYRRGWARDGNREVESLKLIGCYKCLLSRRGI